MGVERLARSVVLGLCLFLLISACARIPLYTYRNAELELRATIGAQDVATDGYRVQAVESEQLVKWSADGLSGWGRSYLDGPEPFIGLAISGGGSRAANFGAAVLQELNAIGLLTSLKAISSVSGGSIPATYYALHLDVSREGWSELRKKMRYNFLDDWAVHAFAPLTIARKLFTDYDRADLLASVFDRVLFKSATFSKLPLDGPELLINATDRSDGNVFTFNAVHFGALRSRLDTFPLSQAVAASGAFPGLVDDVTLRDYSTKAFDLEEDVVDVGGLAMKMQEDSLLMRHLRRVAGADGHSSGDPKEAVSAFLGSLLESKRERPLFDPAVFSAIRLRRETIDEARTPNALNDRRGKRLVIEDILSEHVRRGRPRYVHLFDGGGADNLGIEALIEAANRYFEARKREGRALGACLLIVADAHVQARQSESERRDTRHWYDIAVNFNALSAVDALLRTRRTAHLKLYGLESGAGGVESYPVQGRSCGIWHVTFSRLQDVAKDSRVIMGESTVGAGQSLKASERYHKVLARVIGEIETSYKLRDSRGCSPEALQTALYDSARILLRDDIVSLKKALGHLGMGTVEETRSFMYRGRPGAAGDMERDTCPASLGMPIEEERLGGRER